MIHRTAVADPAAGCGHGVHRPRRSTVRIAAAFRYTVCRDCGATLFQTQVSRKWILSGRLA